jgi:hypothetical protein
MSVALQTVRCPFCREPIAAGAVRCKHCQADLTGRVDKKKSSFAQLNTFRTGFLSGILFCLILAVLAYFQFFGGD